MGKRGEKTEASKNYVIYTYDLSKVENVKKVRFVYALKGRSGSKGLVKEFGGEFLVPGCFMIPVKSDSEMQEVFRQWDIRLKRIEVSLKEKEGER